jgi:hypothetical protein
MIALKDDCVSPTSKSAYIQSITGGKDNSKEGLQVSYPPGNDIGVPQC